MRKNRRLLVCMFAILAVVLLFAAELSLRDASGQVRAGRRGAAVKGEEGKGAAVGRRGAVAKGDEGAAAVGRRGAVVAGEEGVAAAGRHGSVVVGNRYEDYEA